jgi:RNA polymerase sigma-70 factor (ECF subfamily)
MPIAFFVNVFADRESKEQMEKERSLSAPEPDAGDTAAIELMISEHGDRLLRAAYCLCRDAALAQDLVQETFCRVIPVLPRYRRECLLYTWLYSVMRNLFFSQRRRQRLFLRFLQTATAAPATPNPGGIAEAEEKSGLLDQAMERLPARHREILAMRFADGMKVAEIAAALGLPAGTVKSRLHNALRRLRRALPAEWLSAAVLEVDHEM